MQSLRQHKTSLEVASVRGKQNNSLMGNKRSAKPSNQPIVQPKLELTQPGDRYEQEADRMADFVMQKQFDNAVMPSTTSVLPPIISRNTDTGSGVAIDTATEHGINALSGGGQALPENLRSQMESGFGTDFSNVRLHTDSQAAQLSQNINAKAFTYGNDIYFNKGQYNPTADSGQHLIAHELTHVVQQNGKVGREEKRKDKSKWEELDNTSMSEIIKIQEKDYSLYYSDKASVTPEVFFGFTKHIKENYGKNSNRIKYEEFSFRIKNIKGRHIKKFIRDIALKGNIIMGYNNVSVNTSESLTSINTVFAFFRFLNLMFNASIEDTDWIDPESQNKIRAQYTPHAKKAIPITVVIVTDKISAGGAFDDDFGSFYMYRSKKGEKLHDKVNLFFIQGKQSISEITNRLIALVEYHGYLQNLIISGHGEWDSLNLASNVELDINDKSTIDFFKIISELMRHAREQEPTIKQSIYLDACLTNSHIHINSSNLNFKEILQSYVGKEVKVWANSSTSRNNQVDIKNEQLYVTNDIEPSILNKDRDKEGDDGNIPKQPKYIGLNVYSDCPYIDSVLYGRMRALADEFILNYSEEYIKNEFLGKLENIKTCYTPKILDRVMVKKMYSILVLYIDEIKSIVNKNSNYDYEFMVEIILWLYCAMYIYRIKDKNIQEDVFINNMKNRIDKALKKLFPESLPPLPLIRFPNRANKCIYYEKEL